MTRTKITLASRLIILTGLGAGVFWMVRPTATSGPLPAQIEQIVQAARDDGLWGNVLVVRGDAVLYEQSSGPADVAADVHNAFCSRREETPSGRRRPPWSPGDAID